MARIMVEDQEGVTGRLKVSHIQSLYTAGRKEWLNFHFVSILSLGRKRMYLVKPPKDAHVECDRHMTNYVGKDAFHEFIPFMSCTSTKMLCVLEEIGYKLVQNAFWKPQGTFARVNIGHVFLFVRFKWIPRTRTP
ncbi:hypothetical protein CFP56_032840 [Quercus suber]|uniref:Uncharacterized protein n=1 Tax=Quercus suber TaxID=58331 RepID=A0AAW0LTP6_QUESU